VSFSGQPGSEVEWTQLSPNICFTLGMITLTFCKLFPGMLESRIAGIILAHTTYTNPVRTTQMASF
jgi:hypothetical protein